MMGAIDIEVRLRAKNQLTLPVEVAHALDVGPGDRLILEVSAANPGCAVVRPVRDSYYGALAGMWGGHEEILAFVREEQASWEEY